VQYQPKGGMCAACESKHKDCSGLDFSSMRKLSIYRNVNTFVGHEDIAIVKCDQFNHEKIDLNQSSN